MSNYIKASFDEHIAVANATLNDLHNVVDQACELVRKCILSGHKVLIFGNGGSASDAQHIAAEFVGRFVKHRRSLPAIALTTDTSALTAIGNDYGFEHIFARQVEGLAGKHDVLIGISTSGNSPNVVNALKTGKEMGCHVIGFSGNGGGMLNTCTDLNIVIPSNITARVQEMHILIGHIICEALEAEI